MDIRNALMENKNFVTYALAGLVEVERDRILSSGLATKSQLSSLSDVTEYMVKMAKNQKTEVLVNSLANLCTLLKGIKLPGDFEKHAEQKEFYIALGLPYDKLPSGVEKHAGMGSQKTLELQKKLVAAGFKVQLDGIFGPKTKAAYNAYKAKQAGASKQASTEKCASEEKFYIALDLPYDGEKFHDLSSLHEDKEEEPKECPECEEREKEEQECETCGCEESDDITPQEILVGSTNSLLKKIANKLGDEGNHRAAYLVERTIRSISKITQ